MLPGFTNRLIAFLLLLTAPGLALAQRPQRVNGDNIGRQIVLGQKMDCNDAGAVDGFTSFDMQSNSFGENLSSADVVDFNDRPDTIFLCRDDFFRVLHGGGEDLSGDPDPMTTPGVGYAFYQCTPTATGPTITDVRADPCVADNGLDPFFELVIGIPLTFEAGNYNLNVANDVQGGLSIPDLFPVGGEPSPVVLTLAPITFDDVENGLKATYENDGMGGITGPCVDVRLDQAFTVAYLNPIEVDGLQANNTACTGSFTLTGGAPELRGNAGYTIVIENTATMARALITNPPASIVHDATINYEVPTPGSYRVSIMDDVSCELMAITVNHADGCIDPVEIVLPTATAAAGTNQCFPVTVNAFTDVIGFQFEMLFDPTILQFTGIANENPALTAPILSNGPPSSGGTRPDGSVRITYSDLLAGASTIADGGTVFEVCFDIVGMDGDMSPLTVASTFGAGYTRDDNAGGQENGDLTITNGVITVSEMEFLVSATRTNETCDGDNDGTITATASNTTGPLTFSIRRIPNAAFFGDQVINTVPGTATFTGLQDGDYEVRIINGAGEEEFIPVTIDRGASLAVNIDPFMEPSCNGASDGAVRAVVLVNSSPVADPIAEGYTFQWAGSTETGPVRTGLQAGGYAVTVTAPNGICMSNASSNLTQPLPVSVRPDNPADAVSSATCDGVPDGSIQITADGGAGSFDFAWPDGLGTDSGETSSTRTGLLPGAYAVTVTDISGCADTANFVVDALKTLAIVSSVDSISCFEDTDGVIRVNGSVMGAPRIGNYFVTLTNLDTGVSGMEVEITDNNIPTEFTGLGVGNYSVTLRDEDPAGCSITETFEVGGPEELEFDEDLILVDETCTTGMDGSATANVTGGTMPYTYRWLNDSLDMVLDTITPGPLLDGLSADSNYVLIVTDNRGCEIQDSFQINAPAAAFIEPIATSFISCPGDTDGQLSATITPPPGFTITNIRWFVLNPDNTLGAQVASDATTQANLAVGAYVVLVETSNGCEIGVPGIVSSPTAVFLETFEEISPDCPGDANGSIFLTPGGGTPNADGTYNYTWSTAPGVTTTDPVLTNLRAGEYGVTIVDANNCQPAFDTTFTLLDPAAITGQFNIQNVSCPDEVTADGSATFTAVYSDGTAGTFNFSWSSGTTDMGTNTSTDIGLSRGMVSVTITDGICSAVFDTLIGSPDDFVIEIESEAVSCFGDMDGSATLNVTGGTEPYTFAWTDLPAETDNTLDGFPAGTYEVLLTDANGCSPGPVTIMITQPDPLVLAVDSTVSTPTVTCAGDVDGRIAVFIRSLNNNDLGPAPFEWEGGVGDPSSPTAEGLAPGSYGVTVTDVEGCQDSIRFNIGEPGPITFTVLPIEEPACFGQTTPIIIDTAFGGTSTSFNDFTFTINNDGFRIPASQVGEALAGDITVTVFDAVGCPSEQSFSVGQPPEILIDLEDEITVELGDSLTRLNPIVSPVGDLYEYLWTPPNFLSSDTIRDPLIFPLNDQNYTFQVTNMNGCTAFADIFVRVDANRNVYIPNVFSPNRDGRNEDFRVFTCQGVQQVNSFQIYDRWGGLVQEGANLPPNCLDGITLWEGDSRDGRTMNPGTFVYVIQITFLDGVSLTFRGDVTLVR